ncbi:MAG TPA: hypothetical protein V6C52_02235 [Coleofasciculaceae cyanobacterium]|jgi:hypothetical protein
MARIIENHEGRRMIRLTADDVLTVVSLYQQQMYDLQQRDYEGARQKLTESHFYLPEDV